jgi:hypothetical protein
LRAAIFQPGSTAHGRKSSVGSTIHPQLAVLNTVARENYGSPKRIEARTCRYLLSKDPGERTDRGCRSAVPRTKVYDALVAPPMELRVQHINRSFGTCGLLGM